MPEDYDHDAEVIDMLLRRQKARDVLPAFKELYDAKERWGWDVARTTLLYPGEVDSQTVKQVLGSERTQNVFCAVMDQLRQGNSVASAADSLDIPASSVNYHARKLADAGFLVNTGTYERTGWAEQLADAVDELGWDNGVEYFAGLRDADNIPEGTRKAAALKNYLEGFATTREQTKTLPEMLSEDTTTSQRRRDVFKAIYGRFETGENASAAAETAGVTTATISNHAKLLAEEGLLRKEGLYAGTEKGWELYRQLTGQAQDRPERSDRHVADVNDAVRSSDQNAPYLVNGIEVTRDEAEILAVLASGLEIDFDDSQPIKEIWEEQDRIDLAYGTVTPKVKEWRAQGILADNGGSRRGLKVGLTPHVDEILAQYDMEPSPFYDSFNGDLLDGCRWHVGPQDVDWERLSSSTSHQPGLIQEHVWRPQEVDWDALEPVVREAPDTISKYNQELAALKKRIGTSQQGDERFFWERVDSETLRSVFDNRKIRQVFDQVVGATQEYPVDTFDIADATGVTPTGVDSILDSLLSNGLISIDREGTAVEISLQPQVKQLYDSVERHGWQPILESLEHPETSTEEYLALEEWRAGMVDTELWPAYDVPGPFETRHSWTDALAIAYAVSAGHGLDRAAEYRGTDKYDIERNMEDYIQDGHIEIIRRSDEREVIFDNGLRSVFEPFMDTGLLRFEDVGNRTAEDLRDDLGEYRRGGNVTRADGVNIDPSLLEETVLIHPADRPEAIDIGRIPEKYDVSDEFDPHEFAEWVLGEPQNVAVIKYIGDRGRIRTEDLFQSLKRYSGEYDPQKLRRSFRELRDSGIMREHEDAFALNEIGMALYELAEDQALQGLQFSPPVKQQDRNGFTDWSTFIEHRPEAGNGQKMEWRRLKQALIEDYQSSQHESANQEGPSNIGLRE